MLARTEKDVDFFSRRALEEARAAAAARCAPAAAAHRHMAAIYAARLREEHLAAEGIADMLSDLDHRELDAALEDAEAPEHADGETG